MQNYDDEYFFIEESDAEGLPFLTPDVNTAERPFSYRAQPVGSAPLIFTNGLKDRHRQRRVPILKSLPDVLFAGTNLVVRTSIREALLAEEIPDLHMHPTVYIHDDGVWHEDYWYLTFTDKFDCWDRKSSKYQSPPIEIGNTKLYSVYTFSLNSKLLNETPIEKRRLFKLGGSQDDFVVCHQTFTKHFSGSVGTGLKFTKVSDY